MGRGEQSLTPHPTLLPTPGREEATILVQVVNFDPDTGLNNLITEMRLPLGWKKADKFSLSESNQKSFRRCQ